jgi:RNA polymerase sigma factor (sigma-70 family)
MTRKSKLSKTKQRLAAEYYPLVSILSRYFLQNRPGWQRALYQPDLEGEGYLALCKAARTYDRKKLPYPKAYFARAVLNAMLKSIRKMTRTPRENKVSLAEAADKVPQYDEVDHLRLAIESLPEEDRKMATERFVDGSTLRTLSEDNDIPVRIASLAARRLQRELSRSLDIRLQPRAPASTPQTASSSRENPRASPRASERHRGRDAK